MIESGNKDIYIVCGATDMREGVDGLAAIVNLRLACDFSVASMFIFCNKSRNRVKIIEWDGDGFWLYQKRLERGTFPWPAEGRVKRICRSSSMWVIWMAYPGRSQGMDSTW